LCFTRLRPTDAIFAAVRMRSLLIISSDIVYAPAHVVIGDLCCDLQNKKILVQRIYCHLIAEVCLEALRFSWLPPQGNICSPLASFMLKKSIDISLNPIGRIQILLK